MSSRNAMNPNGGAHMRRVTEQPDPNVHLLERILSRRDFGILRTDNRNRPLAPAQDSAMLLKTVAIPPNQNPRTAQTWRAAICCGAGLHEQQRPLADVPFIGDYIGVDQSILEGSGTCVCQRHYVKK